MLLEVKIVVMSGEGSDWMGCFLVLLRPYFFL